MKLTSKFCRFAAPSWVFPGTILENCRFLESEVDEAALLFFDAESSLAYTRQDLPSALASLALSYHVHLPSTLPWDTGGEAVAALCLRLMEKVAHLGVSRCVLHPPRAHGPSASESLLEAFAREWEKAGRSPVDVCIENTRENDLVALIEKGFFTGAGFGLCLDLGHMLAYDQKGLAGLIQGGRGKPIFGDSTVRMLHYNAPGNALGNALGNTSGESSHLPLTVLDEAGLALGEALCGLLAPEGILVAEFFSWNYVAASMPIIRQWVAKRACGAACGG